MISLSKFFSELSRRRVLRLAGSYIVGAWFAVEILSFLLEQISAPGWSFRLLSAVLIVGFPVAMVLAWVIQVEPEKGWTYDPTMGQRKVLLGAVALGVLATAGLSWLIFPNITDELTGPVYIPIPNSVAILPLETSAGTPNEITVADTLYAALQEGLAQSTELNQVLLRLEKRPPDLAAFGRGIRSAMLLSGRIIQVFNGTQIELELLDVNSNKVKWSQTYNWNSARIMDTGNAIASGVLQAMDLPVMRRSQFAGTDSRDAYEAVLLGVKYAASDNFPDLRLSIDEFQRAIDIDPRFTQAHINLAMTIFRYVGAKGPAVEERKRWHARARKSVEIAQELGGDSASVVSMMGRLSNNPDLRIQLFERALELDPHHAPSYFFYGGQLLYMGNLEEAQFLMRRALEYEPMNARFRAGLSDVLYAQEREEEAHAELLMAIEIEPRGYRLYHKMAAREYLENKNAANAIVLWRQSYSLNPESGEIAGYMAHAYADLGARAEAMVWLERAVELSPTHVWGTWMMTFAVQRTLGELDLAREALEQFHELAPSNHINLFWLGHEDIKAGNPELAVNRWHQAWPVLLSKDLSLMKQSSIDIITMYTYAVLASGRTEWGREILDHALRLILTDEDWNSMDYLNLAYIYAMLDQKENALNVIAQLMTEWPDWAAEGIALTLDPRLDAISDLPEFQRFQEIIASNQHEQLIRILNMERNGELAPARGLFD